MAHNQPTLKAKEPLDVVGDVESLKAAMKGVGTDEDSIITILTTCSNYQRQLLGQHYHSKYKKDLISDLKKELSGYFEDVIVALMTPRVDYLAEELHHACKSKNGRVIVEILCTSENFFVRSLEQSYERLFDASLEESLTEATSGIFQQVMLKVVEAKRSTFFSEVFGRRIACEIYNEGNGLDETELVKAMSTYSYEQLRSVFVAYYELADRTLGETIDCEYSGSTRTNMRALFDCVENRRVFFAESFHAALADAGTNDKDLIRLVVSRCEIDLGNIKTEYHNLYNKHLEEDVKADTSGDYKKVLVSLLG